MIIPVMGMLSKSPTADPASLAGALFTPVQQRVLGLLFGQPGRRFQSAELIRLAGSGTGATHRLLQRLSKSGLVHATVQGRQKYYQANPDCPIFGELTGLIRKTAGLVGPLREALSAFEDRIEVAFVYGSVASGLDRADSDIDLMVVAADLDYPALFEAVQSTELRLGRPVNPTLMTPKEWRRKLAKPDSFVARLQDKPQLCVMGVKDEPHESGESRTYRPAQGGATSR